MWVYQETPETAAAKALPEAILPTAQEEPLKQKNRGVLPETAQEERRSIPAAFSESRGNTPERAAARRSKPSEGDCPSGGGVPSGDLSGGCGGSALRGRRCRNAFLLPELLAEPVFRAGCRRSSAPVPNGISHCGRCADGSAVPGAFCPWAAAHLPFYDAVWDRFRIAFVRIAFRFEPTDNICAALRLRYPCIPCGRNVVHVRRIRTAGKRKALFSRLRAWRTGPQHRLAFGSVCPDAVSAPAALRCGSGDAVSGRAGKTYLS